MQDLTTHLSHPRILFITFFFLCGTLLFCLSFSTNILTPHLNKIGGHDHPLSGFNDPLPLPYDFHSNRVSRDSTPQADPLELTSISQGEDFDPGQVVALPSQKTPRKGAWLIGVSVSTEDVGRRMLIRNTWQTWTKDHEDIETVFVLARPANQWQKIIERENEVYNDLVILEDLEDDRHNANTRKSCDWLAHVVDQATASGSHPKYVSKVDTDAFPNIDRMYEEIMFQRLLDDDAPAGGEYTSSDRTYLGYKIKWENDPHPYAQGSFYTLSWPLVEAIATAHKERTIFGQHEDILIGRYLFEERITYTFLDWTQNRHHDLTAEKDMTDEDIRSGKMLVGHMLKADDEFLAAANMFARVKEEMKAESESNAKKGSTTEQNQEEDYTELFATYETAVAEESLIKGIDRYTDTQVKDDAAWRNDFSESVG
ncbi:uncharacterized protein KY384_008792 [Bacidia gigantensis]|uniref:uncharacterized protein n=1 Tax=Bacidia gigantensis TaxID=2732470 RepID=UPI001D04AFAA|nr:uncharacterized protein KY384_008792 [Bacidia gigantensis]KAG8526591.1 hypothetical protein KY384_008792 [Bacidia gigantensis]